MFFICFIFDADLKADLLDSVRKNVERFNAQGIANSLLALNQFFFVWRNFVCFLIVYVLF